MSGLKIVYIIGFMGSGKTTAGKKLSGFLGWNHLDLDTLITEREGRSISDIFEASGEEYFRSLESNLLRDMPIAGNTVISVGGGAPCSDENIRFMKETGLVVYLKKTPGQLFSRLSGEPGKRPLLTRLTKEEMLKYIRIKLEEREPFYKLADISVLGMDIDIGRLAKEINSAI